MIINKQISTKYTMELSREEAWMLTTILQNAGQDCEQEDLKYYELRRSIFEQLRPLLQSDDS